MDCNIVTSPVQVDRRIGQGGGDIATRYRIARLEHSIDGFNYAVEVLRGDDDMYWEDVTGTMCRTLSECNEFIRQRKEADHAERSQLP